jgi:hypothetical protein
MLAQAPDFSKITYPAPSSTPPININDLQHLSIGQIISVILPYIFAAAGIALLIYLILGGLQLMTSQGDPKAIEAAKGKITNAVIGFVIVFIAFFVVQLLGQLLHLQSNEFFKKLFNLPS